MTVLDPHEFTEKLRRKREQQQAGPQTNGPSSIKLPTMMTAEQLLKCTFPEPRFVVPDVLTEGLTILAGKPKLGKSWATFDWALAITSPALAFGKIACEQGDVLVLALEDSFRRMQGRLRKLGAKSTPQLTVAAEWPRLDAGGLDAIQEWLRLHPKCRMIVVDTLVRLRPRVRNRDAYQADADSLEQLHHLASENNIAIVVVHHVRKATADDWIDAVSGTAGLTGVADSVLVLKRERGQADAFLFGTGRDLIDYEKPLQFDENTCRWQLLDMSAAEAHATTDQAAIIALLRQMQPAGLLRSQIAAALDRSKQGVSNMLTRMEDAGIVVRADNNLWKLTV